MRGNRGSTTPSALVVALVVCVLCGVGSVNGTKKVEIEKYNNEDGSFVVHGKDLDPYALKDNFMLLSEAEQLAQWSDEAETDLASLRKQVEWFDYVQHIDVVLVGFEGDGPLGLELEPEDLEDYFDALLTETSAHFLNGPDAYDNSLTITADPSFIVNHAPRSLGREINDALESVVKSDGEVVPFYVVDDIIGKDYLETGIGYTIYILNPNAPRGFEYSYSQRENIKSTKECTTNVWAGKKEERYVWIDLTAGPVVRGPKTSGEGVTSYYTVPRVDSYLREEDLVVDLVGVMWTTVRQLIIPPQTWFPVPDVPSIKVHFIEVTDRDEGAESAFKWHEVADQLAPITMPGQTITFPRTTVSFSQCAFCAAAYAHALRSHTSTKLEARLESTVHDYLDSAELAQLLNANIDTIIGKPKEGERIIPVVVFDLKSTEVLLLDRFDQAVSFPDLVVAVQSQAGFSLLDYSCNGRPASFEAKDATRAVLAGVLQTGWGVAPTHEYYITERKTQSEDYLWSVGYTPFGPFSPHTQLSFAQTDAAYRNVIFSHIDRVLDEMLDLFDHFQIYNKEVADVLTPQDHLTFVQRWNVFSHKLVEASVNLSVMRLDIVLYYMRSLKHEMQVLHELIHNAGKFLHSDITCLQDPKPTYLPFAVASASGLFGIAVMWNLDLGRVFGKRRTGFKPKDN